MRDTFAVAWPRGMALRAPAPADRRRNRSMRHTVAPTYALRTWFTTRDRLPHDESPGVARGLLRLAGAPAGVARAGGRTTGARDRRDPRGDSATLWEPPDSRGAGGARVPDGSQARGAAHAGARAGRPSARGCSSGGVNRKRWQLNPGVYQTGASPLRLAATLYRDMGMTYRAHEAERPPRAAKARGSPM